MAKLETHFQQIPLDSIKKIIEGERPDEAVEKDVPANDGNLEDASPKNDDTD